MSRAAPDGASPPSRPRAFERLLALDTSSSRLSAAVGAPGAPLAQRQAASSRSSAVVMELIDDCLKTAGLSPEDLDAVIVLAGPGSFTGLRVGMALAMGLHQALELPVGTLTTFQALAATAPIDASRVFAAVRAGRDAWLLQGFDAASPRAPLGEPLRVTAEEVVERSGEAMMIGFGLARLETDASRPQPPAGAGLVEATPLAVTALGLAEHASWEPRALTRPLYLAPPPADPAARR